MNRSVSGDMAYELGHYALTVKPKATETDTLVTARERYLVIWEQNEAETWEVKRGVGVPCE